jgi:hypothetical protein
MRDEKRKDYRTGIKGMKGMGRMGDEKKGQSSLLLPPRWKLILLPLISVLSSSLHPSSFLPIPYIPFIPVI